MSLADWLLTPGGDVGVVLGVLKGWDQARCHPALGGTEVEQLMCRVAEPPQDRLEGVT
jgi:hypothetical protein